MKLGELFVDLGVNSGNALNSLTNFSLKFLAIKNAASQFADSIDGLFGDTARYGQQLIKNNFITGQSIGWMQKMKFRAEQVGASFEDVIGVLKNLQKANADILMGKGDGSAFQILQIDMNRLRQPAELLDEIMSKLMRLEPAFRQALASELGISEQVLFMYQQKTLEMNKQLLLTQEEADALNSLNKEWLHLQQAIGAWWDKKIAGMADHFRGVIALVKLGLGITNEGDGSMEGKSLTELLREQGDLANVNAPLSGGGVGTSVVYNDNSQTTINTSDGVAQHEKIANNKVDKNKSQLSNLELFSRRGKDK